jgi:peptidoglycan/LPS O-acetylase OafA/YrhL
MVQLDALRAFAVLAVLVAHFPPSPALLPPLRLLDLGGLGVRLFFVISGFLITGILLTSKNHCEKNDVSIFYALRQFYLRRTLRIFPLFYLVLGLAALFNISPVRETGLWHAAYLTNFYLFFKGWDGSINHFWSLAVEEQFYLIWPWIILLVNRRRLPAMILAVILIGPIFRLVCGLYTGNDRTPVLPLSCLDTLGVGALLALRKDQIGNQQSHKYPFGKTGLFLGFVVLTVFVLLRAMNHGRMIGYAMFDMGAALIAGWMVWNASIGIGGPIGTLLEIKPLLYLGTISYGIYVYHSFAYDLFIHYLMHLPMTRKILIIPHPRVLDSLLICGITIAVAALSWHLFERPINDLKRYFKYYKDRAPKKAARSE